jgi:hypothetical protein
MKVWSDLLSTDYGLMSLLVIVFVLVAMLVFAYFVYSKTR